MAEFALPDVNVSEALARAGESIATGCEDLAHLFADATVVNGNLYGDGGAWPFSAGALLKGCQFYSDQAGAGGSKWALGIASFLVFGPYLGYRVLVKDLAYSFWYELAESINTVYLTEEDRIDTNDTRHPIAKTAGVVGFTAGKMVKGAFYTTGLLGLSSFGLHQAAAAFKECVNFICDTNLSTKEHEDYLAKPRSANAATFLKHVNLVRLGANALSYCLRISCGVLGLTDSSMQFMFYGWNYLLHKAFGDANDNPPELPDARDWKQKAARWCGVLGWVGIIAGGLIISFAKIMTVVTDILGFSQYGISLSSRAFKHCINFLFDAKADPQAENYQIAAHDESKGWCLARVGLLARCANLVGYTITFACGVLGFTVHSMRFMQYTWNVVSKKLFGKEGDVDPVLAPAATWSKEWFARGGALGLMGAVIGTVFLGASKIAVLVARGLGISDHSGNTVSQTFKQCMNFLFDAGMDTATEDQAIKSHEDKQNKTAEDYADQVRLLTRLSNGLGYIATFACGVLGFTVHSMSFMQYTWSVVNKKLFGKESDVDPVLAPAATWSKEWFARGGALGLMGAVIGTVFLGASKVAVLVARGLGISSHGGNSISQTFKQCMNFLFDAEMNTQEEDKAIADHENKANKTAEDYADQVRLLTRLSNGLGYVATFACGVLGFTVHSMRFMQYTCSVVNKKLFGKEGDVDPVLTPAATWSKEWFARGGALGLMGAVIGTVFLGASKVAVLVARGLGISDHSGNTVSQTFKQCMNFLFDAEMSTAAEDQAINDHKAKQNKTAEDYADQVRLLTRLSNGLGYIATFACGVLGFTVHSMRFMQYTWSVVSKKLFGKEGDVDPVLAPAATWSKEWFARGGALGLMGAVIGTVFLGASKVAVLVACGLGISSHGGNNISQTFKQCMNFLFDAEMSTATEDQAIKAHEDKQNKTAEDYADQVRLLTRLSNGLGYIATFACGVLGFTVHSMRFMQYTWSVVNKKLFGKESDVDPVLAPAAAWSKEWFARGGALGLMGAVIGTVFLGASKIAVLIARGLGISSHGGNSISQTFKQCMNFLFNAGMDAKAEDEAIKAHENKQNKTAEDYADQARLLVRISNGLGYIATFACGVLGFTAHSIGFMQYTWSFVSKKLFGKEGDVDPVLAPAATWSKEWFARGGALGLMGAVIGTVFLGASKVAVLVARGLGISSHGGNSISQTFKQCMNFLFNAGMDAKAEDQAIKAHEDKQNKTAEDYADQVRLLTRISNGLGYVATFACGVLGFTAHSMRFMGHYLNVVKHACFGGDEPAALTPAANWKEQLARGGLLGLIGLVFGTVTIAAARIVNWSARLLGISSYSGNQITRTFKQCANFVFGSNYSTDQEDQAIAAHEAKPNPTIADRADRIGMFGLAVRGFTYVVSGLLGLIGLTAANYHRAALTNKKFRNMFLGDDEQLDLKPHEDYLAKQKQQNAFTKFTSTYNLLNGLYTATKVVTWVALAATSWVCRRVWKLTLGNFETFSNATGTDGFFSSTSLPNKALAANASAEEKLNNHFKNLLWCLDENGNLPQRAEGESKSFEQAISRSQNLGICGNIQWRIAYEFRKSASVFSLDSIAEKVILHFAATFKKFLAEARRTGQNVDQARIASSFFNSKYDNMVAYIQGRYNKAADKQKVVDVSDAIKNDVMREMHELQPGRA